MNITLETCIGKEKAHYLANNTLHSVARDICDYTHTKEMGETLYHKLPRKIQEATKRINAAEFVADTVANNSYSFVVGMYLDSQTGKMTALQSFFERINATGINTAIGGIYGQWRNVVDKKILQPKEEKSISGKIKELGKYCIREGLAFNTGQTPIIAALTEIGDYLINNDPIDWSTAGAAYLELAKISLLVAPTYGWFSKRVREFFHVPTPSNTTSLSLEQ